MSRHPRRSTALFALLAVTGCGTNAVPSALPSPASTASHAVVEPTNEERAFDADADRLRADLATLQRIADENGGIRAVGTPGFDASVDAMAAELEDIGFEVTLQEVPYTGFREIGASLTVGDRTFAAPDELHALIYSASGGVAGAVAMLDGSGCDPDDFAGIPDGAIAVTVRGGCFRRDQALNAQAAGAAALVVGYPGRGPGQIYRPTLIDPAGIDILVVSITDDGIAALDAADGRSAHLEVRTEREPDT
ncbi:MAG TPA: PA domain-containing protein, partial [Candidatus Limnocylindria bacterium]|nr:PA domain-containing protein [Candidatus Limnocylindria bacterium]